MIELKNGCMFRFIIESQTHFNYGDINYFRKDTSKDLIRVLIDLDNDFLIPPFFNRPWPSVLEYIIEKELSKNKLKVDELI
jgi:hypothetical protein